MDGSICLTVWYAESGEILAFELIFGLTVDEWAFRYHRTGKTRYCKVDDGNERFGRNQKQVLQGEFLLPKERIEEFVHFHPSEPIEERKFVIDVMKNYTQKKD